MIEVTVHDVVLRAPKDDPEAEWLPGRGKRYKLRFTRVMLLKEQAGDRLLPIWVGAVEGDAPEMMEQATQLLFTSDNILEGLAAIHRKYAEKRHAPQEEIEKECRSFRSIPRGDVAWIKPAEK